MLAVCWMWSGRGENRVYELGVAIDEGDSGRKFSVIAVVRHSVPTHRRAQIPCPHFAVRACMHMARIDSGYLYS